MRDLDRNLKYMYKRYWLSAFTQVCVAMPTRRFQFQFVSLKVLLRNIVFNQLFR